MIICTNYVNIDLIVFFFQNSVTNQPGEVNHEFQLFVYSTHKYTIKVIPFADPFVLKLYATSGTKASCKKKMSEIMVIKTMIMVIAFGSLQ